LLTGVNLLYHPAAMDSKPPLPPEMWERTPAEAQEYIRALEARVAVLEAMVQRLQAALQQVMERLQQDSRTSLRPPSSDPPQATGKRLRRDPSGRRPGGQPGHEGQARAWLPVEAVDGVMPVKPERCSQCEHPLQGDAPAPQRPQVTEIPSVQPRVTEDQLHGSVCARCGAVTRAALPPGTPLGASGHGCRRSPRGARGPITCPNALPSISWRSCLASH
jgi:transposase